MRDGNDRSLLDSLSEKNFDIKNFIKEVCKMGFQRNVNDMRDHVSKVQDNTEKTLKNYVFENYHLLIDASNQISHIESNMKELYGNISKQKKAIKSIIDTSNLLDSESLFLNSNKKDEIQSNKNRHIIDKIEQLDSILAMQLTRKGGFNVDCKDNVITGNKWMKDPLNILSKIHMKVLEFQFDQVYQLTESVDFFSVLQNSIQIDEKDYLKVKVAHICRDLIRISTNIFLENSSLLPLSQKQKKIILKCLINLGQHVKAVELYLENAKTHLIDLLKNFGVSVDTMLYLENITEIYFKILSYIINEYNDIFDSSQLNSYLFCWLNTTLKCYVEQMMHVIQIRCQTFHVLTKWYSIMEETNHRQLSPLGFNMLFYIDQCIYKHVDAVLNSLLYGIKKRIKDGFSNEQWNNPVDASALKDLETFEKIHLENYLSQSSDKLHISKMVCSFVKFLVFFSLESKIVNKTFELNQCIINAHIQMLQFIYTALEPHVLLQKNNLLFINSVKLLLDTFNMLQSNYPELEYVTDFTIIKSNMEAIVENH